MTEYLSKKLRGELGSILTLLDERLNKIKVSNNMSNEGNENYGLLTKCREITQAYDQTKPKLRVIQHLACSGGTLISKCIGAQANVHILSEAHPTSNLAIRDTPSFSPTDLAALTKYAHVPDVNDLLEKVFYKNVMEINQHIDDRGGTLVVRYHTHTDYHVGEGSVEVSSFDTMFSSRCELLSVLTIRNPIDAYSSLKTNGWIHFSPPTFDKYCKRYLQHLNHLENSSVFRYEDFVDNPLSTMMRICQALDITYDESFIDTFSLIKLTGDSGRKSSVISKRDRRADKELLSEVSKSENFNKICELGWYESN